ncbi:MAG: rhomboid family intramembrane serine protease [Gammaproteobacteria bacterium]
MRPVTLFLLLANVAVFAAQQVWGDSLVINFALWPRGHFALPGVDSAVGFEPWQLITYAFLHANLQHIAFNMFALYMFGSGVEQYLGSRKFLVLYFASVISAAITQLIVVSWSADGMPVPTLGASGGVFGLLLAFGWLFPRSRVTLIFPPIPMPAWVFVTLYGLIELGSGVFGTQGGVAHFAHLGGMVGAFLVLQFSGKQRA